MDLLRFFAAGNVDDGKSTLMGRLLFDSNSVSTDILQALEKVSRKKRGMDLDLSLLTDGLRAEREQGITIDVAYKYFTTASRKFIIADTPGHAQYTRNMVTGVSNSHLAIILIDAQNGITEQTCRHSIIASMFGIQHLVICVNKMDLIEYSEKLFNDIVSSYEKFAQKLNVRDIVYVPISAKFGDNVVRLSDKMSWYKGRALLHHLETVDVKTGNNLSHARFPIQYVIRSSENVLHNQPGYAGKIVSGFFKKGDAVEIYPNRTSAIIKRMEFAGDSIEQAYAPQSIVIYLEDNSAIGRGDVIAKQDESISVIQDMEATVCWMHENALTVGCQLLICHHAKTVKAVVRDVLYKVNVISLDRILGDKQVCLNEIARITLHATSSIVVDRFQDNPENGYFILVDEFTNDTVGVCII